MLYEDAERSVMNIDCMFCVVNGDERCLFPEAVWCSVLSFLAGCMSGNSQTL